MEELALAVFTAINGIIATWLYNKQRKFGTMMDVNDAGEPAVVASQRHLEQELASIKKERAEEKREYQIVTDALSTRLQEILEQQNKLLGERIEETRQLAKMQAEIEKLSVITTKQQEELDAKSAQIAGLSAKLELVIQERDELIKQREALRIENAKSNGKVEGLTARIFADNIEIIKLIQESIQNGKDKQTGSGVSGNAGDPAVGNNIQS